MASRTNNSKSTVTLTSTPRPRAQAQSLLQGTLKDGTKILVTTEPRSASKIQGLEWCDIWEGAPHTPIFLSVDAPVHFYHPHNYNQFQGSNHKLYLRVGDNELSDPEAAALVEKWRACEEVVKKMLPELEKRAYPDGDVQLWFIPTCTRTAYTDKHGEHHDESEVPYSLDVNVTDRSELTVVRSRGTDVEDASWDEIVDVKFATAVATLVVNSIRITFNKGTVSSRRAGASKKSKNRYTIPPDQKIPGKDVAFVELLVDVDSLTYTSGGTRSTARVKPARKLQGKLLAEKVLGMKGPDPDLSDEDDTPVQAMQQVNLGDDDDLESPRPSKKKSLKH